NGIALTLTAGHEQRVEVSAATEEFRRHIVAKVEDGTLLLAYDDLLERDDRKLARIDHKLAVAVTADFLTGLTAGSGAVITTEGNFAAPDCVLDFSSGATLTANDLAPNVLVVRETGGATLKLAGRAPRLDIRAGGGATFDGQRLLSARCQVEASGGSSVRVLVSQDLLAEASGGASIRYTGHPLLTKTETSGGSVSGKDK
ncbi:MAG: DUF2807 domain-containing protein, partial [Hymenobacter sp.]